jgi:small subunit ribosomal protein S21
VPAIGLNQIVQDAGCAGAENPVRIGIIAVDAALAEPYLRLSLCAGVENGFRAHGPTGKPISPSSLCLCTGSTMIEIEINEGDRIEWALKQFRRKMLRSGLFKDMKKKRFYEKPSEARKRKQADARRRVLRARRRR